MRGAFYCIFLLILTGSSVVAQELRTEASSRRIFEVTGLDADKKYPAFRTSIQTQPQFLRTVYCRDSQILYVEALATQEQSVMDFFNDHQLQCLAKRDCDFDTVKNNCSSNVSETQE